MAPAPGHCHWQRQFGKLSIGPWSTFYIWGPVGGVKIFYVDSKEASDKRVLMTSYVDDPEKMVRVLGMLLVLIQEWLPRLLQQQSGETAPSSTIYVHCTLTFGSGWSMWAPLAPLLRELHFFPVTFNSEGRMLAADAPSDNSANQKRVVFCGASKPHLDVVLKGNALSWGASRHSCS